MPHYLDDLPANGSVPADAQFHMTMDIGGGVRKDRKVTKAVLASAIGGFSLPYEVTGFFRMTATGFKLFNPTTNKYHTITLIGAAGAVEIVVDPTGET